MPAANPSNTRGALVSLLAFAVFSSHDVIVKLLGAQYSAFQIVFFSVLFGFPIVTIMLIRDRTDGNLQPRRPWWTALRTASAVIGSLSVFYAFSTLPLAETYAILFAAPLMITLLAIPILGETVGWRRGGAIVVGLIGVMVVLQPGSTPLTAGHLAALSAAMFSALGSVIVRKIGNEERSVVLLLYPMVANFLVMACILPFVYVPVELVDLGGFGVMALLVFLATLLQITAYRAGSAVVVAPMQYSQIIWAVIFGALFFSEYPDMNTAIGAAIVICSGIYIVFREDTGATSENSPVLNTRSRFASGPLPRVRALQKLWRKPV
ncbi:MAG: EamA/RhaT family transporter [Confluentimicrobium sp.]|jgi:S-adenosylmethionine uptake transporter|uniref:S-adenosylmethionine uptake transporter n=1 Tax=Actibacterium naphthalenivorans TaxID=1614693 RepID=A0A840CBG0_9RHOB|nr:MULTISPECIES: DMT family transporter [Actibacterium]KGB82508.1 membrane protein [Rhodovulum sp. NI22]MDY6859608.1 DMT family transporter [Pseudomonadota bacterium]ALG89051.1 membrane protein [Actibacterium sp. EMB200-NS6]MBB4021392.1 S-adenosylmethionine uptake transporter [Actibacterium naphthalenivorans]MBC56851.1 EamA/RhaT family transporter [Actibacterium sp.]|tara:strand:+ start:1386 stop:2351 length:966 start_codon:yes stop_codon:yes gene_type:complete